jgi:hypothetical protein
MGAHILPEGWREWHPGETDYLPSAFFAEYNSSGPGADFSRRETHAVRLTQEQAQKFEPEGFLRDQDGWNPIAVLQRRR